MKKLSLQKQQSGAALVIGLVILLVMTLLGVSSMNSSRTELKIAANIQNKSIAFQAAENAIQRVVLDPATPWSNLTTTATISTFEPTGQNFAARTVMLFEDCRRNPQGYDLSGDGVGDGAGSNNKAIVHNIRSTGETKAATTSLVVASSAVSVGVRTMLAGCTPPASTGP